MQISAFQLHSDNLSHGHSHGHSSSAFSDGGTPAENRVWAQARKHAVAQILELGIALHRHAPFAAARHDSALLPAEQPNV